MKKVILSKDETDIENNIESYVSVSEKKRERILAALQQPKVSITLRVDSNDLEKIKTLAEKEGMPYQTLISSVLHKYINNSLVDERSIKKAVSILSEK
ncbi:MAG TPA: CopG family antitoxin [Spirochaetota bacterium]|nr:CopG family antitoxin [Spirochaetota bacterium]